MRFRSDRNPARPAALPGLARSPPRPRVSWVVHGRGFGHGVGMSAYGAYGFAKHGKSYRFILGHYYRGRRSATLAEPRVVRVLLDISPGDVGFSGATSACGMKLDPTRSYEAHRIGNSVVLRSSGGKRLASCGRKLRAAGNGKIAIAGYGTYRGALETVPTESDAGSLNVVNALALEQYVKGVMPNEVPPSWPIEELKAQVAGGALDRPHRGGRRQRLRPLRRHPQPGLRGSRKRVRADQRGRRRDPRPGRRCTAARSPRPSTRPARAATPRASSTSSARRSPTSSAFPTPTTTTARCTNGR